MDMDDDACYRAFETRDARFDGRIFSGVKTTGVYCRPVCPARTPKRENMRFFRSAAAAQQAGFRPCLRCRPETSPDLGAWRGASNTVTRGLALIEAGALNGEGVDSLAERLGVGERQLRRLFQQHLGASPLAVAQTRRVLLAKQLIHETRMPMAEVALASGFGSVRRFNETFQQLFSRPPGQLRRGSGCDVAAASGAEIAVQLPYRPPYDWRAMLGFLAARAIPGVESVNGEVYARTLAVRDASGVVTVEPGDGDRLRVTLRFPDVRAWPEVLTKVRRVFDLAADPAVIGAHLSEDPDLAALVAVRPGLRAPGAWDGFELAVRAILGQQITVRAARLLAGRLTASCGAHAEDEAARGFGLGYFFPTPAQIAGLDVEALAMPRARGRALVGLARAAQDDPDLFGPRRSLAEAVAALRALPGVGEWTAQYISMRALREPDAFPSADIGLMRALSTPDGRRPTAVELLARAERWRPWRAYAASHLWAADPKNPSEVDHVRAA